MRTILVTGFEPFGAHAANPTEGLAKAVDGRRIGDFTVQGLVLPVHHADTAARLEPLLAESSPEAVLHLGLAGGRARIALERVAINCMDYEVPDNAGYRAHGEPCVPGGPTAYFSTLPLPAVLRALVDEGRPADPSNPPGTDPCHQTLHWTVHAARNMPRPPRVGLVHFPLLPAMVATTGLEQPSMDFPLMLRAVETILGVIARGDGQAGRP